MIWFKFQGIAVTVGDYNSKMINKKRS